MGARVLGTGLALVLSVVVSRVYGAAAMGVLAVMSSFLGLATIFTVLGTNTSILRLIPEQQVKYSTTSAFRLYRKTQYFVILVSFVTSTGLFLAARRIAETVFGKPHLAPYLALAALFILFNSIMHLNTQAVRGLKLIRLFAFMQLVPTSSNLLILLALPIFLVSPDNPVYAMLSSLAVTGILGWVIMEMAFRERMQPGDVVHAVSLRKILSISVPMLLTATMSFIIGHTATIIIAMFRPDADVGYFSIAVKLATLTSFALGAINSMAGPKFSELFHSGNMDELFHVAQRSAKLVFWTTVPILIFLAVLGRPFLIVFYGDDFAAAYPSLLWIVGGQFVNSACGCTSMFMNMTGNERIYARIILLSAAMNIALSFWLVPRLGIVGAAFSNMVSVSFLNLSTLIYAKVQYGRTTGYFPWVMTDRSGRIGP